jgi:hypothetical protein
VDDANVTANFVRVLAAYRVTCFSFTVRVELEISEKVPDPLLVLNPACTIFVPAFFPESILASQCSTREKIDAFWNRQP